MRKTIDTIKTANVIARVEPEVKEKAEQIMAALEIMGVVGPYNEGESREVLPFDEPDDSEDGADNE